jgi:hypothetical protein
MLGRLADEDVLALAADEERAVVTHNVRHFFPMARSWMEMGRSHAGSIVVTLPHTDHGAILRGVERVLAPRPERDGWIDRVEFLGRA